MLLQFDNLCAETLADLRRCLELHSWCLAADVDLQRRVR